MLNIKEFTDFFVGQDKKMVGNNAEWLDEVKGGHCTGGGFNLLGTYNDRLTYETWQSDTQNCGLVKHDVDAVQGEPYIIRA